MPLVKQRILSSWEKNNRLSSGQVNYKKFKAAKKLKQEPKPAFVDRAKVDRIREIEMQIKKLRAERNQLARDIKQGTATVKVIKPWLLYALRLEGGYYYVGISKDVNKRFKKHSKGKGAMWTKK